MTTRTKVDTSSKEYIAWMLIAKTRGSIDYDEPLACYICNVSTAELRQRAKKWWTDVLIAHHWRGYDYPLDVWWVCPSCHKRLRDCGFEHDGGATLEQVKVRLGYVNM